LACAPAQDGYSLRPETLREIEKIVGSLKVEIESIGSQSPDVLENIKPKIFRPNEQSKSVLLVEDDKDQAEQLKRGLSTFGYDLEIIDEPADITRAVEKFQPAAIILDLDICGNRTAVSDAVRRLRSAVGIECPVIATTEHSGFEARLAAVRAGCVAFLPKPLNITEIVHILDTATDQGEDEPQRILMIDDDPDVTQFVTFVLRSAGMISEGLSNPYLVLEKLEDFSPELILIDLWMPRCSGKEIAAIIRQQSKYSSLPIVFLSGETDTDVQLEAMDEGGGDFITKPVNPKHLVSTIRSRVARFRMLRDQMVRDSMTGLFNHATTKEMLETEIERARRSGARLTFAMLDIDRFKSVNDTHGHGVGDMVIKTLTRILTSRLRRVDIVGRLGGEEVGVVLGETSGDRAIEVMEDIRTTFETTPHQAGESTFHVTVSCGIAEFPTFDSTIPLSEAADHALYEAKSSGRNRVVLAKNSISSSDGLQ
jgi:diguanylate cyclase (GGDEF)-like protein